MFLKKKKYILIIGLLIVLCFLININVVKAEGNIACSCLCDSVLVGAGCTNSEADCQEGCDELKDEYCPTGAMSNWVVACSKDQKCKSDGVSAYCVDAVTGKVEAPPTTLEVPFGTETEAKNLGDYIRIVYDFGVILVAIVAVAMVVWGGFKWATSAGNSSQIASAKQSITGALIGLVLALTSWLLLMTINPALVDLKKLEIPAVPLKDVPEVCLVLHLQGVDVGECKLTKCGGSCVYKSDPSESCGGGDCDMCVRSQAFELLYEGQQGAYAGYVVSDEDFCTKDGKEKQGPMNCVCEFGEEDPDFLTVDYKKKNGILCLYDWECKSDNCGPYSTSEPYHPIQTTSDFGKCVD